MSEKHTRECLFLSQRMCSFMKTIQAKEKVKSHV